MPDTLSVDYVRKKVNKLLMRSIRPDVYVMLPSLPLTSHGKLDSHSLEEAFYVQEKKDKENGAATSEGKSASVTTSQPLNEKEKLLAAIWMELLNLPSIASNDDFFELGGNSVLAAQMVNMAVEKGSSIYIRS